jgi:hypothetical protein
MHNSFPEEALQSECLKIVHDVLGTRYVGIFIRNFRLVENDEAKTSHVKCTISFSNEWKEVQIAGVGYGMVDALFTSMMKKFTKDFSSLSQIEFDDFAMRIKFKNLLATKTDAPVEIKIALKNKQNQRIYFSSEARSMVVASVSAIRKAFEYLINAERAFLHLQKDVKDAAERSRGDLTKAYTNQMATLVRVLSYEGVVKKNTY